MFLSLIILKIKVKSVENSRVIHTH